MHRKKMGSKGARWAELRPPPGFLVCDERTCMGKEIGLSLSALTAGEQRYQQRPAGQQGQQSSVQPVYHDFVSRAFLPGE